MSAVEDAPEQPRYLRWIAGLAGIGRVLRFDPPGVGTSDSGATAPTLADWADAGVQVLDAAGVDRVALVAAGASTMTALRFVERHPERVSALVLINGTARTSRGDDYPHGVDPAPPGRDAGDRLRPVDRHRRRHRPAAAGPERRAGPGVPLVVGARRPPQRPAADRRPDQRRDLLHRPAPRAAHDHGPRARRRPARPRARHRHDAHAGGRRPRCAVRRAARCRHAAVPGRRRHAARRGPRAPDGRAPRGDRRPGLRSGPVHRPRGLDVRGRQARRRPVAVPAPRPRRPGAQRAGQARRPPGPGPR